MTDNKKQKAQVEHEVYNSETNSGLDSFLAKNKKIINYGFAVLLIIVLGFIAYNKFILQPKEKEADEMIYMAQMFFEQDSFALALNGYADNLGFEEIASEYSGTKSGNLAKYYAGVCNLKLGNFDEAIEYLSEFETESPILKPLSIGALGDAYSEKQEYEKAAENYKKAAEVTDNKTTTPMFYIKAGLVYEELQNYQSALDVYTIVKDKYPQTQFGINAVKYVERAKTKIIPK